MTRILYIVLIFAGFLEGNAREQNKPMDDLRLKIAEVALSDTVAVEIGNPSQKPMRIWKDSNSWGAARWRLLRIRKGVLETFVQNPNSLFTRNVPSFDEIAGGSHIERKLNLNAQDWRPLGHKKTDFQSGDLVIVIYDVPVSREAREMNVWWGVAATSMTVQ